MVVGPGRYDDMATLVREQTDADAVVLIVLNGKRGSGFSVQESNGMSVQLPELLRMVASGIEADLKKK